MVIVLVEVVLLVVVGSVIVIGGRSCSRSGSNSGSIYSHSAW